MAKYLDSEGLSTLWERIQTLANINGIEYIVGTQDEATNAWEGTSKDKACGNGTLYTGKVIVYHLPVAGTSTAATLNLTLPDGTTTGAKDVHRLASSTVTTTFAAGCDIFMVYNGTRWKVSAYVDANTNTIGYQLRSNSYSKAMTDVTYRYRLLFSSADNSKWVPANTSTSTNATASRAVCQTPINPFGEIVYYSTTASVAAGSRPSAAALWQQYTLSLGYSFNRTGAALELTSWKPVYVKCAPQANGSAIIDSTTPYVQDLPSTEDGKIYIFLGVAYSATAIELLMNHPVFYYKDGAIRQWNNAAETGFVVDFVYDENEEDYVCSKTYSEITAALAANRKVVGVAKYNNAIQGIYSNVYTTGNSVYFVQLDEGEGSSPEIFSFILSNADELTTSTHHLLQDTDSVIRGANNIWCSITIGSNDAVTVSNNPFTDFDSYIFGNEQSVILKASVTYNSASYSHDVLMHAKYTGTGAANRKYIGITLLEYTNNKYLYLEFTNTTASGKVVEFYSKPSTGIPSTDLASAVTTSLGKADTSLQPDVANDIAQGSITSSTGQGFDFIVDSDDNVLQDVLDAKANDGAVVHKTGNETIAGNKTFSGNAIFSDLDNVLIGNTSIGEIMEDTYAAKDEMAVTVSGNNTTITLNENLSATVINAHQDISGKADKSDTYTKAEVNNLIPSIQQDIVVGALPTTGSPNTIYRVPSTSSYTDWAWDGTQWVELATYNNAIDDVPTQGSDNLVKSGGVWNSWSANDERLRMLSFSGQYIKPTLSGYAYSNGIIQSTNAYNSFFIYYPKGIQTVAIKGLDKTKVNAWNFFLLYPSVGDVRNAYSPASMIVTKGDCILVPYNQPNTNGVWLMVYINTLNVDVSSVTIISYNSEAAENAVYKTEQEMGDVFSLLKGNELTPIDTTERGYISPTGTISSGYSHYWLTRFDVSTLKLVFVSGLSVGQSCLCCAYDSNGGFLRTYEWGITKAYEQFPILLPDGAAYILVTNRDAISRAWGMSQESYMELATQTKKIGVDSIKKEYTINDVAGISWNRTGGQVANSSATINGIVVPLKTGRLVRVTNSKDVSTRVVFSHYPAVGDSDGVVVADGYIAQEGDAYMLLTIYVAQMPYLIEATATGLLGSAETAIPLKGKRVMCFGDSLTELLGVYNLGYVEWINIMTGAQVFRAGVGATWLTARTQTLTPTSIASARAAFDLPNLINSWTSGDFSYVDAAADYYASQGQSVAKQVTNLKTYDVEDCDVVTIFSGTNDYSNNRALGNVGSADTNEICGAMNAIIQTLLTANPKLKIFWFTPIVRWFGSSRAAEDWCDVHQNGNGVTLKQYAEGIEACAEDNHIPVCNLYRTLGWNKFNFSAFFNDNDSTHPFKGFEQIARRMVSFINSNY